MPIKIIKAASKGSSSIGGDAPYSVGYRRPPKHTQFQKGASGNPNGRPKGSKNFDTILAEELAQTIQVTERGRAHVVTKGRAIFKTLIAKALSGDQRATANLLKLFPNADQANRERLQARDLDQVDRDILAAFRDQLIAQLTAPKSTEKVP